MPKIKQITAREILDSRGNPTIETKIIKINDNAKFWLNTKNSYAKIGVYAENRKIKNY